MPCRAPKGTNNLSGEMALEGGVATAFWAIEDLGKANNGRQLTLLPIGIRYSWRQQNWDALDQRLSRLEQHLSLPTLEENEPQPRQRLLRIGSVLLDALAQLERMANDPPTPLLNGWKPSAARPQQSGTSFRVTGRRHGSGTAAH